MERTPPPRRVIRLFPDYSRDYPLWEKWLRDGEWLARRLQEEVQSFADVQREFGPHRDGAAQTRRT